jgi:hypothetical protein
MDLTSIIIVVIVIAVVYLFIKFIVSPLMKLIAGVLIFVVLIYVLQRFFNLNLNQLPFGESLNFNKWISSFNWITNLLSGYINSAKTFFDTFIKGLSIIKK